MTMSSQEPAMAMSSQEPEPVIEVQKTAEERAAEYKESAMKVHTSFVNQFEKEVEEMSVENDNSQKDYIL